MVLKFVPHQTDAWATFRDHAQRYFEAVDALSPEQAASALCVPGDPGCGGSEDTPPQEMAHLMAEPLELARLLGRRTAEMHAGLAIDPLFAAAPASKMLSTARSGMSAQSGREFSS